MLVCAITMVKNEDEFAGYTLMSMYPYVNELMIVAGERYDHLICTIPLPEFSKLCSNIPDSVQSAINKLQYNSITTALFKYPKSATSWVYYPSKEKGAHRMVCQGNLSDEIPGCVALEKTGNWEVEELIRGFSEISMDDFIARSETQYAYPVYDHAFEEHISLIREFFEQVDIGLVGRFAEWKYYNMDTCMKRGFDYVEELSTKLCHK